MRSMFEILANSAKDCKKNASTLFGYSAWLLLPFALSVLLRFVPISPIVQFTAFILVLCEFFLIIWLGIIIISYEWTRLKNETFNTKTAPKTAFFLIQPSLTVLLLQILILTGGVFLFIIPVFIFWVWFGFSQFCVIFEGKRGLNALSASKNLIKNKFFKSAVLLIIGPIIILLAYSVILSLIVSILCFVQKIDPVDLLIGVPPLWLDVLEAAGQVVLFPFMLVYATRAYLELKTNTIKE